MSAVLDVWGERGISRTCRLPEHALKDVARSLRLVVLRTNRASERFPLPFTSPTRAKHDQPKASCHVLQGVFWKSAKEPPSPRLPFVGTLLAASFSHYFQKRTRQATSLRKTPLARHLAGERCICATQLYEECALGATPVALLIEEAEAEGVGVGVAENSETLGTICQGVAAAFHARLMSARLGSGVY